MIQFTAAPGVGDEIQVRHMGFAGATTADVSGFYGRTGNVVLGSTDHITTGDITARNINATGILTASSANFSGNVSIGGTLTYEDVTNIDSVGVVTARNGLNVSGGNVTIAKDIDVDGHTNLDNVSVAGVSTFAGDIVISSTGPKISLNDTNNNPDYDILNTDGTFQVNDTTNGSVRFRINSGGRVDILQNLDVGSNIKLGNAGVVTATSFVGDGSNLTGVTPAIGITTNLSGSFTASAGSPSTINTFGYGSGDIVVEYTIFIKNGSDFQTQKLLAMRDGTTIHSTQFAVMFSSSLLVQCDATISSGNILLRATPETGVSGSTTYKIKREVM